MTIQRPRGTRDFLPEEAHRRAVIRRAMQDVAESWGYREVSTPTFEHLELFTIKSGEGVLDEIYSFEDKGGRDMALRPELTAPVMRMYVNELQNAPKPQRLYYYGNCFRYERPQKGRFREFWQFGAELIGGRHADSEAEAIALADGLIRKTGLRGDIHVGYLGLVRAIISRIPAGHRPAVMRMIDKKERQLLRETLEEIGADHLGLLELIDLKGKGAVDKAVELSRDLPGYPGPSGIQGSPAGVTSPAKPGPSSDAGGRSAMAGREVEAELGLDQFQEMVDLLDFYGVEATVDFEIVRGLEYYSGTVFEIYAPGLGAQSQICGGGTYELASLFGGQETSSTGFGLGFDRIMEVVGDVPKGRPPVVMAYTPEVKGEALRVARELRRTFPLVVDVMGRGLGLQLKAAAGAGAEYVIILGKKELEAGTFTLRDMRSGEQESLSLGELEKRLS